MENFVNRETELQIIEEKFDALLGNNDVMGKRIVEFYGVGGIGKTTILRKIEQRCRNRKVPSVWTDASQNIFDFAHEIISQVRQYNVSFLSKSNDLFEQSVTAAKALLLQGPLVFLIDSLDAADEEQLAWIERLLGDLAEDDRLFAIVASKRKIPFERIMSIARRLIPFQLKPFNHDSYIAFLDGLGQHIESDIRDTIFEWTYGYPLAVNIMVQTMHAHKLNPMVEQDKKQLLSIIIEQVIVRGVLANVPQTPDDLQWYRTMLTLFSVPRRCNLSIMQKIVERFAPNYKLGSSLAYMTLPKRINQATEVLSWNQSRIGFSVEPPIRHIFLLKLKIEEKDRYATMHRFLAAASSRFVDETTGTDRIHYMQEYLYHCANCEHGVALQQSIERIMQQIIAEPHEYFLQFHEDFLNDEELRTALGRYSDMILSSIYRQLSSLSQQVAFEVPEPEKFYHLYDFLYYAILDPIAPDILTRITYAIQEIVTTESNEMCYRLYSTLFQDTKVKEKLGTNISVLSALLT